MFCRIGKYHPILFTQLRLLKCYVPGTVSKNLEENANKIPAFMANILKQNIKKKVKTKLFYSVKGHEGNQQGNETLKRNGSGNLHYMERGHPEKPLWTETSGIRQGRRLFQAKGKSYIGFQNKNRTFQKLKENHVARI